MLNQFTRTQLLIGEGGISALAGSHAAVFGIGGVGSYAAEALARCGVGALSLFDDDKVCLTNLNRQLIALRSTVGRYKVQVMRERILDINPKAEVRANRCFYGPETAEEYDLSQYDCIIDAIDTVSSKLLLIERATVAGVPVISCMGAGNKLNPALFEVADIYQTSVCPLARVMRNELRKRGITALKVVYSKEVPIKPMEDESTSCKSNCICPPDTKRKCDVRRQVPGSVSFVPSVAGLIAAGEAVAELLRIKGGALGA